MKDICQYVYEIEVVADEEKKVSMIVWKDNRTQSLRNNYKVAISQMIFEHCDEIMKMFGFTPKMIAWGFLGLYEDLAK